MKLLVALSLFGAAAAVELTPDKRSSGVPSLAYIRSKRARPPRSWDDMTDGKTVFIKFLAPW